MKKILLIAAAVMVSVSSYAQGTINFGTVGGPAVRTVAGDAAVGTAYSAALYFAPAGTGDETMFMQVGAASSPISNGWLLGGTRTLSNIPGGSPVSLQVRAWNNGGGTLSTYEAAFDAMGEVGRSGIFDVIAGGAPTSNPPGAILGASGYQGLQLSIVPEPSVLALGALGVGALLLLRRRK